MVGDTIVTCYVDQPIRWGKGIAEWRRESSVLRITTRRRRCRRARPTFVMHGVPRVAEGVRRIRSGGARHDWLR
jgi:hypothetical protein